jgi:hypothetical protein
LHVPQSLPATRSSCKPVPYHVDCRAAMSRAFIVLHGYVEFTRPCDHETLR